MTARKSFSIGNLVFIKNGLYKGAIGIVTDVIQRNKVKYPIIGHNFND